MSSVFVSYKREDELRVARIVHALERAGIPVWWDRELAAGESWRSQIQASLEAAGCVIVVWTHASVGPAGDFVRGEAAHAKRRGALVPVLQDKVSPPLGFEEIQAVDLTRWKGGARDPFFLDLVEAVNAKLQGRSPADPKGPRARLKRRLAYASLASLIAPAAVAFGLNLFRVQDRLCTTPVLQPHLSDACGALGLGDRPGRQERLAWEARVRGSCADLRAHIDRFPDGTYRDDAANLIAARSREQHEEWVPASRRLVLFGGDGPPSADEATARASALGRAQARADRLCKGFSATSSFRLKRAIPSPQTWDCRRAGAGVTCAFEGEAVCDLEERRVREVEVCGRKDESRGFR